MDNQDIPLSKNLEKRLQEVCKRYLNIFYLESLAKILIILIASYLLFYISDRLWNTPSFIRLSLSCISYFLIFRVVKKFIIVRQNFKKDYLAIVKLLQSHFTDLSDSLQGAIELAYGKHRPANISMDLCHAAIEQVDKKMDKYQFLEAINYASLFRLAAIIIFVISCLGGLVKLESNSCWISFQRWINPLNSTPRFLFTQLSLQKNNELVVIKGEKSQFKLGVSENSYFQPTYFNYKFRGAWKKENFLLAQDGKKLQKNLDLPPLTKELNLKIRKGDFYKSIKVIPKERPQLLDIRARIKYPDYLGTKIQEKVLYNSKISLLPDSQISFIGVLNKNLKKLTWKNNDQKISDKVIFKNKTFNTPFLNFNEKDSVSFSWLDIDDIKNDKEYKYVISFEEDSPPIVSLRGIKNTSLLSKDIIEIFLSSKDDFGIKELGYEWVARDKEGNEVSKFSQVLEKGSFDKKNLETEIIFSPVIERIPEASHVVMRGFALDYRPHSEKIYSQEYQLYVLSDEEHLEIIEEKFQSILQRLKNLMQSEQNNIQRTETIEIYSDKKLLHKEVDQELLTVAQFENDNYKVLKNLISRGGELIKEARQNELFRNEIISSWIATFRLINQLANEEVTLAKKKLQEASTIRKIQKRRDVISDGKDYQEQVLRTLEDLTGKYADINRDSAINTFAIRFRKNSEKENIVSEDLKKLFIKTAGIQLENLAKKEKDFHQKIIAIQKKINDDISSMEQELFTLFNQTKIKKYKAVYEKMITSNAINELKKLESNISKNRSRSSIAPSKKWSETFLTWADLFDPPPEESEEEEQEENEEQEKEQEENEDAEDLLVVIQRLADEEEKIYKLTKNLTRWNRNQRYKQKIELVKERQKRNAIKTAEVSQANGIEVNVQESLASINGLMGKAYKELEEKGAGQEALNFEASSLELLLALIQEKEGDSKGNSKNGKSGKSGKKSDGKEGGDSDSDSQSDSEKGGGGGEGKGEGLADAEELDNKEKFESKLKKILKGNSANDIINDSPVEFHKALESYYQQLENK